jgi:hypothetical protein
MRYEDPVCLDGIIDSERYGIIKPHDRGAWGVVYVGVDRSKRNKKVAIKVLDPNEIAQTQMVQRGYTEKGIVLDRLGVPEGTVMSRLFYARQILQRNILTDNSLSYNFSDFLN